MHKPDLSTDFLVGLENCEKGPCMDQKPKGVKFLKDI